MWFMKKRSLQQEFVRDKRKLLKKWVGLEDAVIIAYEALENTVVKDFIDPLGSKRSFYFIYDFLEYKMTFGGVHHFTKKFRIIPPEHLENCNLTDNGLALLYLPCESKPSYVDVMVKRADLKRYIKKRKKEYKAIEIEMKHSVPLQIHKLDFDAWCREEGT